jgi:hypothetical protein
MRATKIVNSGISAPIINQLPAKGSQRRKMRRRVTGAEDKRGILRAKVEG